MNIDNSSFITDVKKAIDYYKRYDKLITSIRIRKDKHDLMLI